MELRSFKMNEFQNVFEEFLNEHGEKIKYEEDLLDLIEGTTPKFAQYLLSRFSEEMSENLQERRELESEFRENLYNRWSKGIDLLEMFIEINYEIGEAVNSEGRDTAVQNNDFRFEAIVSLHARSLLVAREILCLLKSGFPDGALGRWRTLHEIAVVATFLMEQDVSISERYLVHRQVQNYKSLQQYAEYQEQAYLTPLDENELQDAKHIYDNILAQHGDEMRHDWGWAAPVINKKPTFRQIEEHVELDHWRPRYRWSSQDTHGGYRPHEVMLALSESSEPILLTGSSDSGLTDPAQMMSVSLSLVTYALIQISPNSPNIDGIVYDKILDILINEISSAFLEAEDQQPGN